MIAIINYGMGNLRSVQKAIEKVGGETIITSDPEVIRKADKVVLPGVGAFFDAIENLKSNNLVEVIKETIDSGKPFLGICLGLHLLFTESEEDGLHKGLDILKGRVVRFSDEVKVPHMGWNQIEIKNDNLILENIPDNSYFYFVHSYYPVPEDKDVIATTTDYGMEFASSVSRDNIFATQFHPEKSSDLGLKILKNFVSKL
ncbi:MAG: imidazole glycerol phosphate synthase subunit HisH [Actinobacteria bacterium]|nr:imidazole glycerol phosphate synthase subunit HisH [Actinomycetota bacterium]